MRYLTALVVALFVLSACKSNTTPTDITTNASSSATPEGDMRVDPTVNLEKKALDDIMKKNFGDFQAVLAPDYICITPFGVYDGVATIEDLKSLSITYLTLSNWRVIKLGNDASIVVYTANIKGTYKAQAIPDDAPSVYSSTAWVNHDGKWLSAFHQECDATRPGAEATTTPAVKKTSVAASPSPQAAAPSTAAPVPTSDAIANEKTLWQMLKTQNWDGFATMLDEDAIEIEPDGINTKSNSVAGVRIAGNLFSTITTSGFKSTKLSESAVLVTYDSHLGGSKPVTYRETTVWANRGGKWLVVLHHGTEVMASRTGTNSR